jgi:hypothetical protein
MLNVILRVPAQIEPRARYAFETLSTTWGLPLRFTKEVTAGCNVVYGERKQIDGCVPVLRCDPRVYQPETDCTAVSHKGSTVWGPAGTSFEHLDLVGSTFRLLTFMEESRVPQAARDRRGIFKTDFLPSDRKEVVAEPLVENHAELLFERLRDAHPHLKQDRLLLWPNGKKYAFLLTHDTDAITLGSVMEMAYNLGKGLLRRDAISFRMFKDGFTYFRRPGANPLFGFPKWRRIEQQRLRSCFYLFVRPHRLKWDVNDCRSTVANQPVDWRILHSMADDGWEFGLHAPIHAKEDVWAFREGKEFIEQKLGRNVVGLRHHYWAIDWAQPHLTFRRHVQAGFRYDTSIAWRDRAGFRAGTCLPFQPFDLGTDRPLDLYEIPTSLMDGHISTPGKGLGRAIGDGLAVIDVIKRSGGVALLNWHTEGACNDYHYAGDLPVLLGIFESVLHDSQVWLATPQELVRHWHERRLRLQAATHSAPLMVGTATFE